MGKFKDILTLSDPYPNLGYELLCYLKAIVGFILISAGIFSIIFLTLGSRLLELALGILLIILGLYLVWQIKLVRKLVKTLFGK